MFSLKRVHQGTLTIILVIIGVALLILLNPPRWILASRIGSTTDHVYTISSSELGEFPALVKAIHLADTCESVHPTEFVKCSTMEGRRIIQHFRELSFDQSGLYWLHLDIGGQLYQVFILFIRHPPPIT